MDETVQMLKRLTDANGIAGNERAVKRVMEEELQDVADTFRSDGLGSLIAVHEGSSSTPRIMVTGHLDEVGFMVTQVTKGGFLKFQTVGGWWSQVMLAQRVTVTTRAGEEVVGVIGSKPPHILSPADRKKPADIKDMFIDVGAASKEEVESWGIRPGDMVTPYFEFTVMNNPDYLLAKAWDNRIGLAIAIEVMKRLKKEGHPNTLYSVGAVQEEVGLRGAKTATAVVQPDIGFAVDVGIAGDTPGVTAQDAMSEMGKGPQIILYDASMVSHKGLRELVVDTAEQYEIPYQFDSIAGGGTDAGSIHLTGEGVPTLAVTIATRYIHTNAAMLHRKDFEHAVDLLVRVIQQLDEQTVARITYDS